MPLTVETFNGNDVSSATYTAKLRAEDAIEDRAAEPVLVRPLGGRPRLARSELQEHVFPITIDVLTPTRANIEQLLRWFAPGTTGPLVVDHDGVSRTLDATVLRCSPYSDGPAKFVVTLLTPDPRWRSSGEQSTAGNITATGGTLSVTNSGSGKEDKGRLRWQPVTQKAAADAAIYQKEIILANRVARPFSSYALEVTNGGWDHAAEVTASRSLASGNDVRVLLDGVEIPRWDGGSGTAAWNQTLTKIWVNVSLSPGRTAALSADTTATSPANGEDLNVLTTKGWPDSGYLLVDDEVLHYQGRTETAFQNIIRGARGTTAAIHTTTDTLYWVERRLQVFYGHSGAVAPAVRADLKPLLDLATSTNTAHVWPDFGDTANPGRSMQWERLRVDRDSRASRVLAPSGAPDAVLDFEYQSAGPVTDKPNANTWRRDLPSGSGSSGGNIADLTRAVNDSLALQAIGTDGEGSEITLATYRGPLSSGAASIAAPTNPVYGLQWYCRSQFVIANPAGTQEGETALDTGYKTSQQFTVVGDGDITHILARVRDTAARTVSMTLWSDNGSNAPSVQITAAATAATINGTTWLTFTLATALPVRDGTKLWIRLLEAGAAPFWKRYAIPGGGVALNNAEVAIAGNVFQFMVISTELGFDTLVEADDSDVATVDGLTVYLSSTGVPYLNFGARRDGYAFTGSLRNLSSGQQITPTAYLDLLDLIEIDVEERAVRNLRLSPNLLTLSGNEITDEVRRAATQGDGVTPPDSSLGLWEATTNLCTNGGFATNTTGWTTGGTNTIARDTTRAKFGVASLKATYQDNLTLADFVVTVTDAFHAFTAWVYVPANWNGGQIQIQAANFTSGVTDESVNANMALTDQWQRIQIRLNPDAGDLVGALRILTASAPTAGRDIGIDGVQIEAQPIPTPYVETDGGTATRSAARARLPAALLDESQGWIALRFRTRWTNTLDPATNPRMFDWRDDGNNNLVLRYDTTANQWEFERRNTSGTAEVAVADTFTVDDVLTLIAAWTATAVTLSVDGAAFVSQANSTIPALAATQADLGSSQGTSQHADGDLLWFAAGTGVLTNADATTIHAFGATDPDPADFPAAGKVTAVGWADSAAYLRPDTPRGERLDPLVVFSDEERWLDFLPGANTLQLVETGLVKARLTAKHYHRWE